LFQKWRNADVLKLGNGWEEWSGRQDLNLRYKFFHTSLNLLVFLTFLNTIDNHDVETIVETLYGFIAPIP